MTTATHFFGAGDRTRTYSLLITNQLHRRYATPANWLREEDSNLSYP